MLEAAAEAVKYIPFEELYRTALDSIYVEIPSPEAIQDAMREGVISPEEAYAAYLQTLVDNLESVDGRIQAVLDDITDKLERGELKMTPELEKLIHDLSHERVEVIDRVKIGPDGNDWIDFEKGMEIRKENDGISYLYDAEGERIGVVRAATGRVVDEGGLREKLDYLKRVVRNESIAELFDEEKDLRPFGLTRESFAEFSKEHPDPEVLKKLERAMRYTPEKLTGYRNEITALLRSLEAGRTAVA